MDAVADEIEHIKAVLPQLSEEALRELSAFSDFLADRERRRKELVARVLKAEQNPDSVICSTVEEAMQAIFDAPDDDDET